MRINLIFFAFLFFTASGFAQQDAQYTQYMYNTININPAYAGSRGALSIFGLYRSQWLEVEGAPVTAAFSANSPINGSNLGMGVSIINDKIGPTSETDFSVDLSYTIRTSAFFKLSFGVKATANLFSFDVSKLKIEDKTDPKFQDLNNKLYPNMGAGIYLHSDKLYVGFSIPNFIETNRYNDNDISIYKDKINYYLIAGYVLNFDKTQYVKFKPAVLLNMVKGAPVEVNLSANFMFLDKFVIGGTYRLSAAIGAMAGFQITDGLYMGYGYDHETTKFNNYNSGSHEIFLRYEFFKNNNKITAPRFF